MSLRPGMNAVTSDGMERRGRFRRAAACAGVGGSGGGARWSAEKVAGVAARGAGVECGEGRSVARDEAVGEGKGAGKGSKRRQPAKAAGHTEVAGLPVGWPRLGRVGCQCGERRPSWS